MIQFDHVSEGARAKVRIQEKRPLRVPLLWLATRSGLPAHGPSCGEPNVIAEESSQHEEENPATYDQVGPFMGEGLESAQAKPWKHEIEQGFNDVRPTQQREHQWNARPDVMERDDDRAEDEIQKGDGKHAGLTLFSKKDEEIHPQARSHDVGNSNDRAIDDRVDLDGLFHSVWLMLSGHLSTSAK
jgi:hypothetical protein